MKKSITLFFLAITVIVHAQDSSGESMIGRPAAGESAHEWYMQPWIWIWGGLFFMVLIAVLFRSNARKKKQEIRK